MIKTLFLCLFLTFITIPAFAKNWEMDKAQSSLSFSGQHAGKDFVGTFREWNASLIFDPQKLEESKIIITISLPSASTGDNLYDKTLPQTEWFNSQKIPEAVFTSTKIASQGGDQYQIDGTLKLKEKTIPLSFPATITLTDQNATAQGQVDINRDTFDIGMVSDPKFEWVAQKVTVKFTLTATQKN